MVYSKKKCRWNADKILSTRWKVIRRGGGYQHGGVESFEMVFEVRRGCKRGLKGLLTRSSSNDRKHRAKAIYLGCICIFKGWGMVGWPRGNPIWGGRNELDWGVWTLTRIRAPALWPLSPLTGFFRNPPSFCHIRIEKSPAQNETKISRKCFRQICSW